MLVLYVMLHDLNLIANISNLKNFAQMPTQDLRISPKACVERSRNKRVL